MFHKSQFSAYIKNLQNTICQALENEDGKAKFIEDAWVREEGGGGITRVIENGAVFEKGGVNTSEVHGTLPPTMQQAFSVGESRFWACGLSIVIHPLNPYVPTIHANWRYFELYDAKDGSLKDNWWGGGTDLTPYYPSLEDGQHFHGTLKQILQPFGNNLYAKYKENCDNYFVNKHRNNEMRGIGGIFYDYLRPNTDQTNEALFEFQQANGNVFLDAYLPIVKKNKNKLYGMREVEWQELRRGRYVEFNLIHDRGTLFGLKTNGRIESILMSLPPRARWQYNHTPPEGSEEAKAMPYFRPYQWVAP